MKTFNEWIVLRESMSIFVKGHDYHSDINDLDDICQHLKRSLIDPIFMKLPKEQQELIRKGGCVQHGIIVPDGEYYANDVEMINFYTAGWGDKIQTIENGIKYYLDELGVKYSNFVQDRSKMYNSPVVRIKILSWKKTENAPPLLNMANRNANVIFGDLLGFPGEEGGFFNISPADLYRKIEMLEADKVKSHAIEPSYSSDKNGPTMIGGQLTSDDIERRLEQIKKVAKWAMENHYDNIYVA